MGEVRPVAFGAHGGVSDDQGRARGWHSSSTRGSAVGGLRPIWGPSSRVADVLDYSLLLPAPLLALALALGLLGLRFAVWPGSHPEPTATHDPRIATKSMQALGSGRGERKRKRKRKRSEQQVISHKSQQVTTGMTGAAIAWRNSPDA